MVNYFIYAKDCSGSTGGVEYYHTNGLKTLEQFKDDVEKMKKELIDAGEPPTDMKVVYLNWGSLCWEIDEDKTRTAYLNKECEYMGTEPETIIQRLKETYIVSKNDKIKLLYIITDGLINRGNAMKCFKLNESMDYETVVFHAFNENPSHIDLSVAASFFKNRCVVYRNYEHYESTDISKQFDYHKIYVDNFATEKEPLKSYIKLKFINKHKNDAVALQEIDKLKKLRDRLFKELSMKDLNSEKKVNLETMNRNVFLSEFVNTEWYKNLSGSIYEAKIDIEKSIQTLINYIVSDVKSYSFDALKFNTKFDKPIEEEEVVDVDFTDEQKIEFPDIILDDEKGIPVIILTKFNLLDKIIFHGQKCSNPVTPASFNKFKTAMECPLFLMNDQDVSESIGYFYTLNVYKQLLENNTNTEPRTRRPFYGGLVLTDTDQFDKYNDYILSATYFDFKKIKYNISLFYFVLWKNSEKKEWMDKNVVEQFKNYTLRRISGQVCKIGLSSLPLDPQINISLLTALWYCVELSTCIFKNDPKFYKHERLRMYPGIARYMIEILKYFNYDLDLESIDSRVELLNCVMILKRIPRRKDKVYYILEKIMKTVNGFLISVIEKPCNLYKLNYLKLDHKEILPDNIIEEKVHLNDFVHLLHFVGDLEDPTTANCKFEICKKTFRPFFVIEQSKSFYSELVVLTRKVVIDYDDDKDKIRISHEGITSFEFDRILSLYKLFIDCVKCLNKFPSLVEYAEFVSRKKKFNEDLVTVFPPNVYSGIVDVFECYQKILTTDEIEVEEFIKVCDNYISRTPRIKAEERVKFTDNEIAEFIASEESKVNLIKKTQVST